jgi:hypothetical protein
MDKMILIPNQYRDILDNQRIVVETIKAEESSCRGNTYNHYRENRQNRNADL